MFPLDMSRSLVPLLCFLAILTGCAVKSPQPAAPDIGPPAVTNSSVDQWLDLQREVMDLDKKEVTKRLEEVDKTAGTGQLYYYGVLNQQLQTYGAWTVARDTFQTLEENEELTKAQRQLAGILRQYNQSRINGYARRHELLNQASQLQQDLNQAVDENRQLQQKIEALTEVEAAISTRKEE